MVLQLFLAEALAPVLRSSIQFVPVAALFQSYFLDNRRSPVRRGADKPVGGFLASRLDIDLNSERFAACAGLRSACDNDQSRHSREVASRFEDTKLLDPRLIGSGGISRKTHEH
jgi:hypothetical protein